MIKFEPETPNIRAFDTLRNKLRQDKKLPPMPDKSFSKQKDYWGKIITHYKVKDITGQGMFMSKSKGKV